MATKQSAQKEDYDFKVEESETLTNLRAKRDQLSVGVFKDAEMLGNAFKKLDTKNIQQVKQGMSKLDSGLEKITQFNGVIADLAVGLTDELRNYTDFVKKTGSYEGIEKIVNMFSKSKAHRMKIVRMGQQEPEKNLQIVVDYGRALIREILEVRKTGKQTYEQLKTNTDIIVQKIKDFQPLEAEKKEQKDAMEAEYKSLEDKLTTATGDEQTKLVEEKNIMHEKLAVIREEYSAVQTKYNQAQMSLAASEKSRDAFEMMNLNLFQQAVMIKEKLDDLTQVYLAAPKARAIMEKTKGTEVIDKSLNVMADECLEMTVTAMEGVAETTMARAKIAPIAEEKMREYIKRTNDVFIQYGVDENEISQLSRRSQKERYGE